MIREKVRIVLETYDMSSAELIRVLVPDLMPVQKGDKLVVTYDLHFDYADEVYKRLVAIEKLLDNPEVVGRANMKALSGGRLLMQDIILKIDKIETLLS